MKADKMQVLKNPVSVLRVTDGGQKLAVPVEVVPMNASLVRRWMREVQPLIDGIYEPWSDECDSEKVRADVKWSWWMIWFLTLGHNTAQFRLGNKSGTAISLCITIKEDGKSFPIGMLTAVPRYYCSVKGSVRHRSFTWYFSDAPAEVYSDVLKKPHISGVAKALMDCAIQSALDLEEDGCMLLHASPKGGPSLLKFYSEKCGMEALTPESEEITEFFTRRSPENYFFFEANKALDFCKLVRKNENLPTIKIALRS